jgi:hypothetical protein
MNAFVIHENDGAANGDVHAEFPDAANGHSHCRRFG